MLRCHAVEVVKLKTRVSGKGKDGRKDAFNQCNFLSMCPENQNMMELCDLRFLYFCFCLEFGPKWLIITEGNDSFITWMLMLKFSRQSCCLNLH